MTLEELRALNQVAEMLGFTKKKLTYLNRLKDKINEGYEYIEANVEGHFVQFETGHFLKFLDVEVLRTENKIARLAKELEEA